jgi:NAD(P)-dependent dehydrogenase (short-subunit alcohol dehydrogenase family)
MVSTWKDKTAVVTGAGSGIGRALALAMSRRGVRMVITDINGESARSVAEECGASARARQMDVRDATAVQAVIDEAVRANGTIDFLFNNAGLGLGGETDEIPLSAWNTMIDVNIRGVVHGIKAAYPHMVRQQSGHIVNTASLAGLGGVPLLAPYSMSKHAVVGLSTSLRHEARARGVRVSVLCPGGIETPLIDSKMFDGQKYEGWLPNVRRYLEALAGPIYPVDKLAEEALSAVERNRGIIVLPARARSLWRMTRWFPGLADKTYPAAVAAERAERTRSRTLSG